MKLFITLLFASLGLISCGKESKSSKRETPIAQNEIEEVMARQRMDCSTINGGECPSGVTRLLIINEDNPDRSSACSGFMISPTRMVTNHHCVATQDICRTTYIAIYNDGEYEQARCKTIIKSEQDVDDPNDPNRKLDYSVMEIDHPFNGEFFDLSNTLAQNGDKVTTWVVDHTGLDMVPSNLLDSRITEFECEVTPSARDSLLMLKCPIISGNSGSPLVNKQGSIVGVIWGGNANVIDSSYDLELRRELDAVGLATEVNYFRDYVTMR